MRSRKTLLFTIRKRLTACVLVLLSVTIPVLAQESGSEWLEAIDNAERIPHSYGVVRQTITTSGGNSRTLTMRSWSDEAGDIGLMVYTDPARVRGDKILLRDGGDNIWYYMKRRDITRHFAGHTRRQKAMGSDFSYEDLSLGSMTEDYEVLLADFETIGAVDCVKLRLTPNETGPSYHHLFLWAGRDDKLTRKMEYWDADGLLKTLHLTDFRETEGRSIAFRMEMINQREDSRTIMEYESFTLAQKPEQWIFTMEALSREIR